MNTKTLIYSIIAIFIIFTGAYIGIAPIATRTLDAPVVENTQEQKVEEYSDDTNKEQEKEDEDEYQTNTAATEPVKAPIPVEVKTPSQPVPSNPAPAAQPSGYTSSEVALHASASSCWSIVNGSVYDLTSYISRHPGGEKNILRICGKDGTSAFEGEHGGDSKPENILAGYKIGALK